MLTINGVQYRVRGLARNTRINLVSETLASMRRTSRVRASNPLSFYTSMQLVLGDFEGGVLAYQNLKISARADVAMSWDSDMPNPFGPELSAGPCVVRVVELGSVTQENLATFGVSCKIKLISGLSLAIPVPTVCPLESLPWNEDVNHKASFGENIHEMVGSEIATETDSNISYQAATVSTMVTESELAQLRAWYFHGVTTDVFDFSPRFPLFGDSTEYQCRVVNYGEAASGRTMTTASITLEVQ